jgi:hypothetical protein
MNRRFCWILLILALGMCIACLPAEAAHSGPSGPASSNGGDTGAADTATGSADDPSAGSDRGMSPGSSGSSRGSQTDQPMDSFVTGSIGSPRNAEGYQADQPMDSFVTGSTGSPGNAERYQADRPTDSSVTSSSGLPGNAGGFQAEQPTDSSVTSSSGLPGNAGGYPAGSQPAGSGYEEGAVRSASPGTGAGPDTPDSTSYQSAMMSAGGSSQSGVPSGQHRGDPGGAGDHPGTSGDITGAVAPGTGNAPGVSSPSGSGTGRSPATEAGMDPSRGRQGSPEPVSGSPGSTSADPGNRGTAGKGQGSVAGTGAAGTTVDREETGGPGRLAIAFGATGAAGAARSGYGGDSGMIPGPGTGRGPSPQRQQQGPPAQAGAYPCGPAQTAPLPQASGQAPNETREESPSRSRFRWIGFLFRVTDPPVPATAASTPALPSFSPFGFLLLGGYRRISRKNVLDNNARQSIYDAIIRRPGIDTKTLADATGINENTLRYHLVRLVATGKIAGFSRPGVVRYFQNQGAYSRFEHLVFHYLWTGTPREILWMLYVHPGQTRQQIADALAIAGPSVTRQMEHLIEDGIVENRVPGRSNHYYLTEEAARTVSRLMIPAPVMLSGEAESRPLSIPA